MRFQVEGKEGTSPVGTAVLYIGKEQVGEARIRTQPGRFGVSGGGIRVGRSGKVPVTGEYEAPFAFTGGVIREAVVDVSGVPERELQMELAAMFARE